MAPPHYLKEIRKQRNMTQSDLAELVGTTQETIQRLESGRRRLTYDWICKLADGLGVHPSEITEGPSKTQPHGDREIAILNTYRTLSEPDQRKFRTLLSLISKNPQPEEK